MDIRHTLQMRATPTEVFRALDERMARGRFTRFARFCDQKLVVTMRTLDVSNGTRMAWRCVEGPPGWMGTDITFDLAKDGDETIVRFAHENWREAPDLMARTSAKWAEFLFALKSWIEIPEADDVYV